MKLPLIQSKRAPIVAGMPSMGSDILGLSQLPVMGAQGPFSDEDAAFIVRACNSHASDKAKIAALVGALEQHANRIASLSASARTEDDVRAFMVVSSEEIKAALAQAKETP